MYYVYLSYLISLLCFGDNEVVQKGQLENDFFYLFLDPHILCFMFMRVSVFLFLKRRKREFGDELNF